MLKVELPAFYQEEGINSLRAELAVAKAFATAATVVSASSYPCIRLEFICPSASREIHTDIDQDRSQRVIRDTFLRLVDRALARVYPPIDVLQYLGDQSPEFSWDVTFCVSFLLHTILPYSYGFIHPCRTCDPHNAVYTVEGTAAPFFDITNDWEAAVDAQKRESSLAGHNFQCDSELLLRAKLSGARARFEHNHQKGSDDCVESVRSGTSGFLDPEDGNHGKETMAYFTERLQKFHKKTSLWLAERIVNEGGWAKPPSSFSSTKTRGWKRGREGMQGVSAASGSSHGVHSHPNILAAATSFPLPSQKEGTGRMEKCNGKGMCSSAVSRDVPGWMLHLDVRGIEFDAVLVAQTARYAYVACPCWDQNVGNSMSPPSAAELGMRRDAGDSCWGGVRWCLVARLPIPSHFVDATTVVEGGQVMADMASTSTNAHPFVKDFGEALHGNHFLQLAEALKFDNSSTLRELKDKHKRLVTVRAHVVRSRRLLGTSSNTSPFMYNGLPLFLWFEDAYLLGQSPFLPYEVPGEVKAGEYSGVLCSDLVELVEASCRRYLHMCERINRYVPANPSSFKAEGPSKSKDLVIMDSLESCEEGGKDYSIANDAALRLHTKLRLGKKRLMARAVTVFSRMTDTRSVYYKKLRSKPFTSVPLISTSRDVEGLFEGPTIEFKHHLGHYRSAAKERREEDAHNGKDPLTIMDVERIRHTIAAMASTMGGVLCVGVTDQGKVVGHERGEVVQMLRTTGFCPAMVAGSVVVKELPVLNLASTQNASNTELATPLKAMPKDWWKMTPPSPSSIHSSETQGLQGEASGSGPGQHSGGVKGMTLQAHFGKVVTIVTVSKGSAPFYASGRTALPYLRGCASTVRMPALIMVRRLAEQFEGDTISYN